LPITRAKIFCDNPKRGHLSLFLILWFAALLMLPRAAQAQEDSYPFRLANFSFEFLGGVTKMTPGDLNSIAEFEEAYFQYYYVTPFNYYRGLYGDAYQVKSTRTGDAQFNSIHNALPYGFRLRYDLSPSLGLSLGVQFLNRTQKSNAGMRVDVIDGGRNVAEYGGTGTYLYQNSGFLLSASAWSPQIAVHFGWQLGRILRLELLVAGGPLFAECQSLNERSMTVTDATGYKSGSLVRTEMTGKGTEICAELGGRILAKTAGLLDFFLEASYAFRDVTSLSGPGSTKSTAIDASLPQDPVLQNWSGRWSALRTPINSDWGTFSRYRVLNQGIPLWFSDGMGAQHFGLDLSGIQLKAGVAIKL
jgi:hypothetical protein